MEQETATKSSWQVQSMPSAKVQFPLDLYLTLSEFERLKFGSIPEEMEDKWFVYHDNGWVHFHRSWSGYCIFQICFHQENGQFVAQEAWANRDPKQYNNDDVEIDIEHVFTVLFYLFRIGEDPFAN